MGWLRNFFDFRKRSNWEWGTALVNAASQELWDPEPAKDYWEARMHVQGCKGEFYGDLCVIVKRRPGEDWQRA